MDGENVLDILADEHLPAKTQVFQWLQKYPAFKEAYERARAVRAEAHEEDILQIIKEATPENVTVSKLQVNSLQWIMSKKLPKQYGDKVTQEVSGVDGAPIQHDVHIDVKFVDIDAIQQDDD